MGDIRRGQAPVIENSPAPPSPREITDFFGNPDKCAEKMERELAERDCARPCYALAVDGKIVEAAYLADGAGACRGCERRRGSYCRDDKFHCPRAVVTERYFREDRNLSAGKVGDRARAVLLASVPGRSEHDDSFGGDLLPTVPLKDTDALRIVGAFVAKKPAHVELAGGGALDLAGNEALLVLAGAVGVGKSIAACHGIMREGGRLLPARQLQQLDLDVADLASVGGILVIDDLGTEYAGAGGWSIARAQELIEGRHAQAKRLIITTNLRSPAFVERYGERVVDRINEGGRWINLVGSSLRGREPLPSVSLTPLSPEGKQPGPDRVMNERSAAKLREVF